MAAEPGPVGGQTLPLDVPALPIETEVDADRLVRLMAHTEATWTRLGDAEPHWSVISAERFKSALVDAHRAEFYASGSEDVRVFRAFLARNGVDPAGLQRVLEYGCGLGRVTRHLAAQFAEVVACDISPSHLRQAEAYIDELGLTNVRFVRIHGLSEIEGPADIDAVFSVIVLQHNPPPAMLAMLRALLHRLRPNGVAYFQVPTYAVGYAFSLDDYLAHGLEAQHIEMHCLPQWQVFKLASDAGCDVLEVREDDWVGRRDRELSNTFLLRRR